MHNSHKLDKDAVLLSMDDEVFEGDAMCHTHQDPSVASWVATLD